MELYTDFSSDPLSDEEETDEESSTDSEISSGTESESEQSSSSSDESSVPTATLSSSSESVNSGEHEQETLDEPMIIDQGQPSPVNSRNNVDMDLVYRVDEPQAQALSTSTITTRPEELNSDQNIITHGTDSFQPSCSSGSTRKKPRKSVSPVKTGNVSISNDEDSMTCPICFEFWTTSGTHRLVSLKCGHLFGLSCIEKWIKQPKARCPQCNHGAKKADIRKLYTRCLKALDTCERDRALADLAAEQEKCRRAEVDSASLRMKLALLSQECERHKQELIEHKAVIEQLRLSNKRRAGCNVSSEPDSVASQAVFTKPSSKGKFVLEKTLDLSKDGGCRIMAVSNMLPLMVTSQSSSNPLFPSFGFKKINTIDFTQTEFVPIHQKPLKDLAFHSHDALVLSTAMDKTVKITNIYSNAIVQSYNLEMDAWSCTWSKDDPSSFFVGLRNGNVLQFDTRMTSTHVSQLPSSSKGQPMIAMQYIEKAQSGCLGMSGPVGLQLSACTFFEKKHSLEYRIHPMPLEGSFTSLSLEPVTGHMLVSCRPSGHHPKVTHLLCELTFKNLSQLPSVIDKCCSCNIVQSVEGGPFQAQLSRSRLLLNPANNSSVLICSGDENSKAVMIWDASNSQCLSKLPATSPVLDVCGFRHDSALCLGTLTDKQLRIYRWNDP